jgi:hypothetical protein
MLNYIIIYFIIGIFISTVVFFKSNSSFNEESFWAIILIAFGWPISILHMIHLGIKNIASK